MKNRILILIQLLSIQVFSQEVTSSGSEKLKVDTLDISWLRPAGDTSTAANFIMADYAFQFPGGDLADRFGPNSSLGGGFLRKTKSNFLFGIDAHYIFGGRPKETSMLDSIETKDGEIIDANGQIAFVRMYERGFDIELKGGKVFNFGKMNANSGLFILAGAGFLMHKIRFESVGTRLPQFSKEYRVGYDRMTNGFFLTQTAGFFLYGKTRLLNGFVGIDLGEGFTSGKRYNFDTRSKDEGGRMDLFFGLRLGWLIPLGDNKPKEYYLF